MKISVSLPIGDVDFLDLYGAQRDISSRSAVIHQAVGLLKTVNLEDAYEAAFKEWDAHSDSELWNTTSADGVGDAAR